MMWTGRFLFLLHLLINISTAIKCVDENNNEVDWFVLYKIPRIKDSVIDDDIVNKGEAYMFLTSSDSNSWKRSNVSVTDRENSFFAKTLQALYKKNNKNLMHIFYNDEPPVGSKESSGHTKGIIAGDNKEGFWLIHSVPLFPPPADETYSYPSSGTVVGQSVLCLSLDSSVVNAMGLQLLYNEIGIYSSSMPPELEKVYSNIRNVINGEKIKDGPWFNIQKSSTTNNQHFISFAKAKQFNKELYEDLVAPYLQYNLLVESWLNGPGKLSSNCTRKFSVQNIKEIQIQTEKGQQLNFTSSKDHSKWALADSGGLVCIGDINRQEPQIKRGGGTVCLVNDSLANNYKSLIGSIEKCL